MSPPDVVLEVIVSTLDDARVAFESGADRAEVVARLDEDGLTPPRSLVEAMLAACDLPLRVMVRPANVFTVTDPAARAAIVADARQWAGLPLDGVVTGYMTADGRVDEPLLAAVAEACGQRVTFHRAIERITAPLDERLAALRRVPAVDRILSGGGDGDWPRRVAALERLQETVRPIVVVAGGGVDADGAQRVVAGGVIREVHVGRTVRTGQAVDGRVDAAAVRVVLARIGRAGSG
jgi:copper homeostasis protein